MEEAKELELSVRDSLDCGEANSNVHTSATITNPEQTHKPTTVKWWVQIAVFSLFLLAGQATATLLGRLYFEKGGHSKWLASLVQQAGFPILIPYYLMSLASVDKRKRNNNNNNTIAAKQAYSKLVVASIYLGLGIIIAFNCYLYSVGLCYIPVSTFSLICASQLAFNAFFSYFLNKQKFTPCIVNSLVLLTISSVLLVFNSGSESSDSPGKKVSRGIYAIGFVCTIGASAGYGLTLALTQYIIANVLRRSDFRVIVEVIFWPLLVASALTVVGLFVSGDWAQLGREMGAFGLGRVSYVMVLAWTMVTWQLFTVGNVGLIVGVSSLFANAVSVLGLPVVPILAVFVFGEKMNGLKAVAMALAVWGFVSYVYQSYLDSQVTKKDSQELERQTVINSS